MLGTLQCRTKACGGSGLRSALRRNSGPPVGRSAKLGRGLSETVARRRPGGGGGSEDADKSLHEPVGSRSKRMVPSPSGVATKRPSRLVPVRTDDMSPKPLLSSAQRPGRGDPGPVDRPSTGDGECSERCAEGGNRPGDRGPGDLRGGGFGRPPQHCGEGKGGTGRAPSNDGCLAEAPPPAAIGSPPGLRQGVIDTP